MDTGDKRLAGIAATVLVMSAMLLYLSFNPGMLSRESFMRSEALIDHESAVLTGHDAPVEQEANSTVESVPVSPDAANGTKAREDPCGNGVIDPGEFCDDGNTKDLDGCSWSCKKETRDTIYVASYVGNIDGGFSEDWFFMFDKLTDFHERYRIPSGFSIYPSSIEEGAFGDYFKRMYDSPYVEFVQKGNTGLGIETEMHKMSYPEVRGIISAGQGNFTERAGKILGTDDVRLPVAYNQPQGRFSKTMRDALNGLGFDIFYEMYKNDDLDKVGSTEDFDVLQYGVGFTVDGVAGRGSVFRDPEDIISDIKGFDRVDVNILEIRGRKIVPIWCHQSDFEHNETDNYIDGEKWAAYMDTMISLKEDPDIVFAGPSMIYGMRHQ